MHEMQSGLLVMPLFKVLDRMLQVERLLDSVDAVIYILDYTKLKTQEEADLLTKLKVRVLPLMFLMHNLRPMWVHAYLDHAQGWDTGYIHQCMPPM